MYVKKTQTSQNAIMYFLGIDGIIHTIKHSLHTALSNVLIPEDKITNVHISAHKITAKFQQFGYSLTRIYHVEPILTLIHVLVKLQMANQTTKQLFLN